MPRQFSLALALAALLSLPTIPTAGSAFAASARAKRHIVHWHGYGFLPGYHQPDVGGGVQFYTPHYYYGDGRYYFGNPNFHHGRWNGGSYGPCWTSTPIGLMWNCG